MAGRPRPAPGLSARADRVARAVDEGCDRSDGELLCRGAGSRRVRVSGSDLLGSQHALAHALTIVLVTRLEDQRELLVLLRLGVAVDGLLELGELLVELGAIHIDGLQLLEPLV